MSGIKVGDLVMLVRWPHAHQFPRELFGRVREIYDYAICPICNKTWIEPTASYGEDVGAPISWLKKIEPPKLDESIDEEIELLI